MAKPQLQKDWTITPNIRYPMSSGGASYNSFPKMAAWFFYQIKTAAVAKGWTLKWSSNGVTGPANDADNTDRIVYVAGSTTAVRGANAASAQTWMVLQNVDGVQMLVTYQGSFDDATRVSFSVSGVFTRAGTATHQPTATDESIIHPPAAGQSMYEGTGGVDRVMSIGCTTESIWWVIYSAGTLRNYIGVEKFDSAVDTVVLPRPYCGFRFTNGHTDRTLTAGHVLGGITYTAVGALNWSGIIIRGTTGGGNMNIPVGGGEVCTPQGLGSPAVGTVWINGSGAKPALQNYGAISVLEINWFGTQAANLDGYAGKPIDWWIGMASTHQIPRHGDMLSGLDPTDTQATALRPNWLISFGAAVVRPWRNADPLGQVKA